MNCGRRSIHPFDQAIKLQRFEDGVFHGSTSPAYQNMVGPFGGTIGATLLNSVLAHNKLLGEPVSLTVHYAAPVADGAFEVQTQALRTNRSTQHWWIEMVQAGETVAFGTAVTALRRETWSSTEKRFPNLMPASELQSFYLEQELPWTRMYDMRFVDGELLGDPNVHEPSQSRLWMRDEPPRPLDFVSLAALSDAFFPRIYIRRPKIVPIGTVAMTTYFHAEHAQLSEVGTDHVLGVAKANCFSKGFFDQSGEIWSDRGELLATTHQVVYFKE